ncbi:cytochrome c biogenesis protein CcsA [Marinoscillum sp. MHG1-6]|uniref:cytochrome c biogenesis protein CcsA n=1 Tax=Marinoscillum sp. MHG1-6 TaxID=2959627 RepID=UPI002157AA64|nr:cytochrome c biogenesis protein CcsA [Marinoscillum sp. MHG1-6]
MIGDWGHFSVVLAFVAILLSTVSYAFAGNQSSPSNRKEWIRFAHANFMVHGLAVLSTVATLFLIIYNHHYEYQYAWKHSSNDLPLHFIVSCFWEGQEGSFLLWIFWNAIIGTILIKSKSGRNAPTMAVFSCVQLFLVSMILGSYFDEIRIGSSPFILLRDAIQADIFKVNPNFVPLDGSGLNPLLQNIWMAIHPPVVFLSFAMAGVPFAISLGNLWSGNLSNYTRDVSHWVLACVGIMGIGIMMGAYWAYETLNFGGYWNWDPVENAIFIPWLILMAACHGLVLYRRKQKGMALTMCLIISGFILVLYSTFLTRSGILGNASVHSFTDLGLSGQLLLFLLFFIAISIALVVYRRNTIGESESNPQVLSLEFWMLVGICIFCLAAFQVLLPTSIPVLNTILSNIGIDKSFAPPADQIAFYSKFQIWFAVGFALLASLGQLFYWKKIQKMSTLENEVLIPLTIALILASGIIYFGGTSKISYMCLITAAIYLFIVSGRLLFNLIKSIKRTSIGGLLAHLGMALMLIGFVYSAGHQKILSQNLTINSPQSNLPAHTVQENLLLNAQLPKSNEGLTFTFLGSLNESIETGERIPSTLFMDGFEASQKLIKSTAKLGDGEWLDEGDTLLVDTENTFYRIGIKTEDGKSFTVEPRMQNNPSMGYVASPFILSSFSRDIYTHVTNFPDPEKVKWDEPAKTKVQMGQIVELKGLRFVLEKIDINPNPVGIPNQANDIPLEASIRILDQDRSYLAHPIYHIDQKNHVRVFPDEIDALGVKVMLTKIDPQNQLYDLTVITSQRDWITIKCIEMPFISLVWLGTIILSMGIGVAFYFRYQEAKSQPVAQNDEADIEELLTIINPGATVNL